MQRALHDALDVPLEERFQVITEHGAGELLIDPGYLGIRRSEAALIMQVFLNKGRSPELKQQFFEAAVSALRDLAQVDPADVVMSLVEVGREDWSFGLGQAQLLA